MQFSFDKEKNDLAMIWSPTKKWTQLPATDPKRFKVFLDVFIEYMQKKNGRTEEDWERVMREVRSMTRAAPPGPTEGFPQLQAIEKRIASDDPSVVSVFADMISDAKFKGKAKFYDLAEYLGFAFAGKYAREIIYLKSSWTTLEPFVQLQNFRREEQKPFVFVAWARGTEMAFSILDCLVTFLKTNVDHRQWCRNAINVLGDNVLYSVLEEKDPSVKLRRLLNAGLYGVSSDLRPFKAAKEYGLRQNVEVFYKLASALFLRRKKDWLLDEFDELTMYAETVAFDSRLPRKTTVRETLANRDFYLSNPAYTSTRSWVVPSVEYFNRVVERVLEGIAEIQWTGGLDVDAFLETF
jgi:hypothetical protein